MPFYKFEVIPATSCLERIAPLWRKATDWGEPTQEHLKHYGADAPGGETSVVLASSESGDVVGATFFVPLRVLIRGRAVRAHQPAAFILDPAERVGIIPLSPLRHPVSGMYFFAADYFRALGDALFVCVPNPRWLRLLKMVPGMQSTLFPLMSLPLPSEQALPWTEGYESRAMTHVDSTVDALSALSAVQYGCTVVRDSRALEWKRSHGDVLTAVERNGELAGVVVSRRKGERQWMICDLLAADAGDALTMTLLAAVRVANQQARDSTAEQPLNKVGILGTALMMPVLERLGFKRDEYNFPLAVHKLDSSLSSADIAPAGWYASGDD